MAKRYRQAANGFRFRRFDLNLNDTERAIVRNALTDEAAERDAYPCEPGSVDEHNALPHNIAVPSTRHSVCERGTKIKLRCRALSHKRKGGLSKWGLSAFLLARPTAYIRADRSDRGPLAAEPHFRRLEWKPVLAAEIATSFENGVRPPSRVGRVKNRKSKQLRFLWLSG
jgi:hypothetical protein